MMKRREAIKKALIMEMELTDTQANEVDNDLNRLVELMENRRIRLIELNQTDLKDESKMEKIKELNAEIKKIIKEINKKYTL